MNVTVNYLYRHFITLLKKSHTCKHVTVLSRVVSALYASCDLNPGPSALQVSRRQDPNLEKRDGRVLDGRPLTPSTGACGPETQRPGW